MVLYSHYIDLFCLVKINIFLVSSLETPFLILSLFQQKKEEIIIIENERSIATVYILVLTEEQVREEFSSYSDYSNFIVKQVP